MLNEMLYNIRLGDILVIWKLDRLGRSFAHLVELVKALIDKGVGLQSLHDPVTKGSGMCVPSAQDRKGLSI